VQVLVAALSERRPAIGDRRYSTVATITRLFLVLATVFGVYLLFVGMTRPHSLALYVHVGASIAGIFLLLVILHARARRAGAGAAIARAWRWSAGVAACAAVFYAAVMIYQRARSQSTVHHPQSRPRRR
jgi:multisubunit Na+/H+ antiporter MnhB subunit